MPEQEVDLSLEREQAVMPAAKAILAGLSAQGDLLMSDKTDANTVEALSEYYQKAYINVVVPVLRGYNLKLNELKYLFQLTLTPMEALKDVCAGVDNDEEAAPLARAILEKIVGAKDLSLKAENLVEYKAFYEAEVVPLLMESKLRTVIHALSLLQQPLQLLREITIMNIETNREIADGFVYDLEDIQDIRISDLEAALKAGVEKRDAQVASSDAQPVDNSK